MKFIVTYQEFVALGNQQFVVEADNEDHARHLCLQAHPKAEIRSIEKEQQP